MMNYIIPRAGEISRCAALSKTDDVPVEKSLGTVVTERIVDMALLVIILGVIFLMQFDLISNFITETVSSADGSSSNDGMSWKSIVLGIFVLFGIVIFAMRKRLVQTKLFLRIFELIQGFGDGLLMMYFCLFAMESTSHLSFADCLIVFAIGTIGVVLPAPGAGAGTYHFFVMQSLLLFGVAKEDGIAYATMVHGIQMIVLLILGAIASVLVVAQQKKKINEQA
jgi:uncharacterized membrane protein YbhN (UPF0104 family)